MRGPSAHIGSSDPDIRELAALFAKGFLRLTRKAPTLAVSQACEREKPLDLPAKQSPDRVGESL